MKSFSFLSQKLFFIVILTGFFNYISCIKEKDHEGNKFVTLKREDTFYQKFQSEPKTLHPVKNSDYLSHTIQKHILETLLQRNPDTYEWEPSLAEKWKQSSDGKTFTFHLYRGLKWSDGQPLTARDVKFSLEAYKNPVYGGVQHISSLKNLASAEIINDHTVRFKAKDIHFNNFAIISEMFILPEHIYRLPEDKNPSIKTKENFFETKNTKLNLNKTVIGSGPYKVLQYQSGKMIALIKNDLWFGKNIPSNKGKWNFKNMVFRFIADRSDGFLRMQKGELDFVYLSGGEFERENFRNQKGITIKKIKYEVQQSVTTSYIGFNLKNPLFQDRRTRKALALLVNRQLMNEKFQSNHASLATGPWYSWSDSADPSVKPLSYDPKKAEKLLQTAGWKDENKDGILEKDFKGQKKNFSFSVLIINESSNLEKYLTVFQEDLKKSGVRLSIKSLNWTALSTLLDERNFDAIFFGEGYAVNIDPKPSWHSESIKKGSHNFIGYSNAKVDKLIDQANQELNRQKRIRILKKIYRLIANDMPCIFFFDYRYKFYAINNRVHTPKPSFKYDLGVRFWSFKERTKP